MQKTYFLCDVAKHEFVCLREKRKGGLRTLARHDDPFELGKKAARYKLSLDDLETVPYDLTYAPTLAAEREQFRKGYWHGRREQ
jgi:hypothetical protein